MGMKIEYEDLARAKDNIRLFLTNISSKALGQTTHFNAQRVLSHQLSYNSILNMYMV